MKCATVSPCNTPVVISKYGVSPSGDLTIDQWPQLFLLFLWVSIRKENIFRFTAMYRII